MVKLLQNIWTMLRAHEDPAHEFRPFKISTLLHFRWLLLLESLDLLRGERGKETVHGARGFGPSRPQPPDRRESSPRPRSEG